MMKTGLMVKVDDKTDRLALLEGFKWTINQFVDKGGILLSGLSFVNEPGKMGWILEYQKAQ